MDTEKIIGLLKELRAMSPMPEDEVLIAMGGGAGDTIDQFVLRYDEIIRILYDLPVHELTKEMQQQIVRTLLDSLSVGGTFEIVEGVQNAIYRYPDAIFYEIVEDRIWHGRDGTRMWSVVLLACKGRITDLPVFLQMMHDPCEDVQEWSLEAIEWLAEKQKLEAIIPDITQLCEKTSSDRVKKACKRVLQVIQTNGKGE